MDRLLTHSLGKSGREVTAVGLGGEGVLRTYGRSAMAAAVVEEAIGQGITYFDSARAYAGSEEYYGRIWSRRADVRSRIFQASKSAARDRAGAEVDLQQTLERMKVDHLDLWQIHDVRTRDDLQSIEGPGGALEAFERARDDGRCTFIGVSGHEDPSVLTYAVEHWPVDTVLLPVNPIEGILGGFLDTTLPAARDRGIAVIGMKVLGAGYYIDRNAGIPPELLIRYALSQEIDVIIVGCSHPDEVKTLAAAARGFKPLPEVEQHELLDRYRPYVQQMAFYRRVL
ncbi:MAG: aldo/keto reductase [Methanomicrobiales archaeon]|nr:aldo/keto reductase [Methanomicrobiales archaeon]MDI6876865.1 aldo/keto reductase [Methanomicrobiales archaeon]